MRKFAIGLLLGFLVAVPIAVHPQQQPERIVVGVPLQIGMPKETVISQIVERGFSPKKTEGAAEETWTVSRKDDPNEDDPVGVLVFTNARLSWASRAWASSAEPQTAKLARSFYFLLKSFEQKGNTSCTIDTVNGEGPSTDFKQLSIHCGGRTATLYVTKLKDQQPSVSLDEQIK